MDLFWIIYFIGVLDASLGALSVAITISIIGGAVCLATLVEKQWSDVKKHFIILLKCSLFCMAALIILPSSPTAYKMLAAYGVTEAYAAAQESDKVQAIAGKSLKVLEKALDDYLGKDGES